MESYFFKEILLFLDKQAQNGKNSLIQSNVIQRKIIGRNWRKEENQTRYHLAIGELIDDQLIEQVDDSYRITDKGSDLAKKLKPRAPRGLGKFLPILLVIPFVGCIGAMIAFTYQIKIPKSPLSQFVNEDHRGLSSSVMSDWFESVPESLNFFGLFKLSPKSLVIETNSQNSTNDYEMTLPVNIKGVSRIRLLINLTFLTSEMIVELKKKNMEVGRIWWVTSEGRDPEPVRLFAGKNIRDWILEEPGPVSITEDGLENAWSGAARGSKKAAVIDCLTINAPERIRQATLTAITIDDRSWEVLASENPGIVIFGVAVESGPVISPTKLK